MLLRNGVAGGFADAVTAILGHWLAATGGEVGVFGEMMCSRCRLLAERASELVKY